MKTMQIRKKAEELILFHGLSGAPVNLDILAEKLRIRIKYEDLDNDVSGFLVVKEERSVVVLNKNHPQIERSLPWLTR